MKRGNDPVMFFQKLAVFEDQYDGIRNIYESDLIAIVLDTATDDYQAVITGRQSLNGENLTLNDLEVIMNQHHRKMKAKKSCEEG
jgi:hypothetical protein